MKMLKQKYFLLSLLVGFALEILVHAQDYDQSGFISIDCGTPRNTNYTDPSTTLNYISDKDFVTTGTIRSIAEEYKAGTREQSKTLRSFPEGTRNCYKVKVEARTRYLIRATFTYGNYDGKNSAPEFDLHIGGNLWDTVAFTDVSITTVKEIIHVVPRNHALVCLVNTGFGTPFVSTLVFRPMSEQVHYNNTGPFESLALYSRMDTGSNSDLGYRYPDDIIDRTWVSFSFPDYWSQFNTTETVDANSNRTYRAPSVVMSTMSSPRNDTDFPIPMFVYWTAPDTLTKYYFYLHIAELQQLKANESREFTITVNEDYSDSFTLKPIYLQTTIVFNQGSSGSMNYSIWLNETENSNLPPILNAYEIYSALDVSQSETEENDVDGIYNLKSTYGVNKRDWDGDPCVPKPYLWRGLNCSYDGVDSPRIISLNLSSSGLTGEISEHLSNLSMIESLDLSNNNLSGSVPDFLSKMPNLRILNLEKNNLSGSIPQELIEKANDGLLSLSVRENINLCTLSECNLRKKAKKKNILIPIALAGGGVFILLLLAMAILVGLKKKRRESKPKNELFESTKRQFTYNEVQKMTNNFERVLGKGGFGEVFHGFIDENTQVAVKILSSSSGQGYQQFQAEVNILMKVYHGNLTNLVGYCYEESNMALIYEYAANGDLASHLSGKSSNTSTLSWEGRLQIAIDAAIGLEYLHNGCKPPIIHRDIKTANILLNENFRAKIADFGLSKSFTVENVTHVSASIAGTNGYLDPKYRETGWLNEKSDVYSFGVVLLEIITSQTPRIVIRKDPIEMIHISQWVRTIISGGGITNVVDPELRGDFDTNSVWKAVEMGMACASEAPSRRPNMRDVVNELKESLALEIARKNNYSRVTDSTTDSNAVSTSPTSEFRPLAR